MEFDNCDVLATSSYSNIPTFPNILSQSVGVNGSMFTVCASGGSTCNDTATY
jgi:hypothetical protein